MATNIFARYLNKWSGSNNSTHGDGDSTSSKNSRSKNKDSQQNYPLLPEGAIPVDKDHPFYFGFFFAAGAVIAYVLLRALVSASQVFLLIIISLFLAAGLNPAVLFFQKRGLNRRKAVGIIVIIFIAFLTALFWIAMPPAINQFSKFLKNLPSLVSELNKNKLLHSLNNKYGVIDSLVRSVKTQVTGGAAIGHAFGGVVGVGRAVVSLTFAVFTVIILTLYFLISLPSVTSTVYRFIPKTRRERVAILSDAIIYRIGSFVGGQATVAVIAGLYILLVALILGIPYASALAIAVFLCGLIPLIGHFAGISIVTLVALTHKPLTALIAFILYLVYIQVENYLIMPRIMRKSLEIPGIVTILAALLGTSLLGIAGGLMAVPIAAAVLLVLDEVVFPKAEKS